MLCSELKVKALGLGSWVSMQYAAMQLGLQGVGLFNNCTFMAKIHIRQGCTSLVSSWYLWEFRCCLISPRWLGQM